VVAFVLALGGGSASCGQKHPSSQPAFSGNGFQPGLIRGSVRQGTIPLGGAWVVATSVLSGKKFTTITDGAGMYSIVVSENGHYLVRAAFRALTSSDKAVVLSAATGRVQEVDFSFEGSAGSRYLTSLWPPLIMPPVAANTLSLQPATSITGGNSGAQFPSYPGDPIFSGDTFVVDGQASIMVPYFQMADQMRQDFEDGHELQGPSMQPGRAAEYEGTSVVGSETGKVKSLDSGASQLHGVVFWNRGNSALNAQSYLLAGQPSPIPATTATVTGLRFGFSHLFPASQSRAPGTISFSAF
jgi:hypothetical protein